MTRYVALLCGINLGAKRRVAMADLRAWLTDLGYADVRTHLQSGNAVFGSDKTAEAVAEELTTTLRREAGFPVDCVLRTAAELRAVVAADPLGDVATDPARYLVSFLADKPADAWPPVIDPAAYEPERLAVRDREAYFWCPDGVHGSRLLRAFGPTGVVATVRNWNTVTRLAALAEG